jgi:hypothetical protein
MVAIIKEVHPSIEPPSASSTTAQRHFVAYDNQTPSSLASEGKVIALFGSGEMPTYGDLHPRMLQSGLGGPGFVAVDFENLRTDESSPYIWRITWNYAKTTGGSSLVPGTPGYWEYQYRAFSETIDAWRSNPGLTFPTNGSNPTQADIGGISIDSCGVPASVLRSQQIVEITEHLAGQYTPATSFAFIKRRNNATFLGAAAGKLVYAGITASARLDVNLFSITHAMVWDEWFHLFQRPSRNVDGEVNRREYGAAKSWEARTVTWYQPFPDLANFNNISTNWP